MDAGQRKQRLATRQSWTEKRSNPSDKVITTIKCHTVEFSSHALDAGISKVSGQIKCSIVVIGHEAAERYGILFVETHDEKMNIVAQLPLRDNIVVSFSEDSTTFSISKCDDYNICSAQAIDSNELNSFKKSILLLQKFKDDGSGSHDWLQRLKA
jgi:hypothetical protein